MKDNILNACDWPDEAFRFLDDPNEHKPCYVIMPGGAMLELCHHALNGVDQARARFIIDACNEKLSALLAQPSEGERAECLQYTWAPMTGKKVTLEKFERMRETIRRALQSPAVEAENADTDKPFWPEPTEAIREVLGLPNFTCIRPAHAYRACGYEIPKKAEEEQAFVINMFLPFAIKYGNDWREHAQKALNSAIAACNSGLAVPVGGEG